MLYNKIDFVSLKENIEFINKLLCDKYFPEEDVLLEVSSKDTFYFQNLKFLEDGILLGVTDIKDSIFSIKIPSNTGFAFLFFKKASLEGSTDSIQKYFVENFQKEDNESILYTIKHNRIYADGVELVFKILEEQGVIAIFSRSSLAFRNDLQNTKDIIIKCFKEICSNEIFESSS